MGQGWIGARPVSSGQRAVLTPMRRLPISLPHIRPSQGPGEAVMGESSRRAENRTDSSMDLC
jgi:hypothetical protein